MNILKNIFVSLLTKVGSILFVFFITLFVSNNASIGDAGVFFYCLALISVLTVIARFGYDNVILRFFSSDNSTENSPFLLLVPILFSFILFLLFYLIESYFGFLVRYLPITKPHFDAILVISFLNSATLILSFVFQAKLKVLFASLLNNVLINFIFLLLCFLFPNYDSLYLVDLYLYSSVITFLVAIIFLFYNYSKKVVTFTTVDYSVSNLKISMASSLWQVALMQQVIIWSSQLFSGIWLSEEQLAILSVAQRISMLISFILVAVNFVTAPMFASYFGRNEPQKAYSLYKKSIIFLFVIALFSSIFLLLTFNYFKDYFGDVLLKDEAKFVLLVLCCGQFINIVTGSVGYLLSLSGNEKLLRNTLYITTMISVVLNLTLIPNFGLYGAALATCISVSLQNLLALHYVTKIFSFCESNKGSI